MRKYYLLPLLCPLALACALAVSLAVFTYEPPARAERTEAGGASTAVVVTLTTGGFQPAVLTVTAPLTVTWFNATSHTYVLHSGTPNQIYLPLVMGGATSSAARSAAATT